MCGIVGYAGFVPHEGLLARMNAAIAHRGPDDEGSFEKNGVGLAIRRLAIIDLTGGHQPIFNEDCTLAIVLNGEIYNFREIRSELLAKGHRFSSQSDTETILHLYEEEGRDCVHRLRGMFAFAIYDTRSGEIFLARDRIGKKPLYYWHGGGKLVFGSEIKSLLAFPEIPRVPDLVAIDGYLAMRYVPGPRTMFAGIQKLPPGHRLCWRNGSFSVERYWEPISGGANDEPDEWYQEQFDGIFEDAVSMRMVADVPVGAFLSGGLDSSCVVTAMSRKSSHPVKTFSVGFDWKGDELAEARSTARQLGCDHHEITCRPEHLKLLPEIVWHSDDPLGDAIVIPTYLLAREAAREVKVVLTGDGADETMAGYMFHKAIMAGHFYAQMMPKFLHQNIVVPAIRAMPVSLLNRLFDYPGYLGDSGKRKLLAYLAVVCDDDPEANYRFLISMFDQNDKHGLYTDSFKSSISGQCAWGRAEQALNRPHYLDRLLDVQLLDWLPDNILARQDKMTMAHGLEGRVPFLDHKLVEFLMTVPPHMKLGLRRNKRLLREYGARLSLGGSAGRKKKPFYIPIEQYVETPVFRALLAETLSPERVLRRGYFRPDAVKAMISRLRHGDFLGVKQIMALVMLELWHILFIDGSTPQLTRPAALLEGALPAKI